MTESVESTKGAPSEATPKQQDVAPQVEAVKPSTTTAQPSEGQAKVQEQPTKPVDENVRRLIQSEVDKARFQTRMQAEQEFQARIVQQQEQAKLTEMDDEQFGAHVRKSMETTSVQQQVAQQVAQQERGTMVQQIRDSVFRSIKSEAKRDEVKAKELRGEYGSLEDFLSAATQANLEEEVAKQVEKQGKQIREAVTKEATADAAEAGGPVIGAGSATSPNIKMSREQLMAQGFAEALEQKRRGR